jgi:hypothetical protein
MISSYRNLDRFSEYFSENKISIENIKIFHNHVSVVLGKVYTWSVY